MDTTVRINKYLPVAVLYFFFNGFLLPIGMLYTTLLTPFFLVWLYRTPAFNLLWIFFLVSIPFALIHFINGVEIISYLKSYLLAFTVYVFAVAFYQFLRSCNSLGEIYKDIVIVNFFFLLMAIVFFFIPGLRELVWYENMITSGMRVPRLKLFTYEASYYSLLLAPIALYFYLQMILLRKPRSGLVFWLVTIPLLLSLSFGVITAMIAALVLLFCSDLKLLRLRPGFARYFLLGSLTAFVLVLLALKFFPNNVIFVRIENVFKGQDTSFSGRTFDSIFLGWKIASQKSLLFGCGPGQVKILGLEIFNVFYRNTYTPDQIAIPNSIGDTLAQYGLVGVLGKLALEVYFFFKTQVNTNYYRLALFLFVFIYQFTGSFVTNISEYVIWLMAFYIPLFSSFGKANIFPSVYANRGFKVTKGQYLNPPQQ
jgi:hypothetical protein